MLYDSFLVWYEHRHCVLSMGTGNKPNCCRLHYNYTYMRPTKFLSLLHSHRATPRSTELPTPKHTTKRYWVRKKDQCQILDSELHFNCTPSSQQQSEWHCVRTWCGHILTQTTHCNMIIDKHCDKESNYENLAKLPIIINTSKVFILLF